VHRVVIETIESEVFQGLEWERVANEKNKKYKNFTKINDLYMPKEITYRFLSKEAIEIKAALVKSVELHASVWMFDTTIKTRLILR